MTMTMVTLAASSGTISVVTHSENCVRGQAGLKCTINSAVTLTLLPMGQPNQLLFRDEHGVVLGTLTLVLESLTLDCLPKSKAWLYSYQMDTVSVKRCPTAGSCSGDYCDRVGPDTMVPELKEANRYPGVSHCVDSSSFWGNSCGLPASACLFYRWFVRPTGRDIYELFDCPGWDWKILA